MPLALWLHSRVDQEVRISLQEYLMAVSVFPRTTVHPGCPSIQDCQTPVSFRLVFLQTGLISLREPVMVMVSMFHITPVHPGHGFIPAGAIMRVMYHRLRSAVATSSSALRVQETVR